MYPHILITPDGQTHRLPLRANFYGADADEMARASLEYGWRFVMANRRPFLDGQLFTGEIVRHWGARSHYRDGLLQDPAPGVPAVHVPGEGGHTIFCQNGLRQDPAPGVPAYVEGGGRVKHYEAGRCVYPEHAVHDQVGPARMALERSA